MQNRIRELRRKENLTLKDLSKKIGLADNTLSQYENGKHEPKLKTWQKLANFFDVSVPYLQGISDVKSHSGFENQTKVKTQNRIKELRKKAGLTLKDLSKETGLADNTLSRYENGKREPKLVAWQKLADFFDVSVPYLQGISESDIQISSTRPTNRTSRKQEECPYCHPPYLVAFSKLSKDGCVVTIRATKDKESTYFTVLVESPDKDRYVYTDLNTLNNCPMCGRILNR